MIIKYENKIILLFLYKLITIYFMYYFMYYLFAQISNMRLPKDANKIRGYGYVEFEDRQSLIDALSMTNTVSK